MEGKYRDIFDIFDILPLYNFKCSFIHVYRANSVFIKFCQLFVSLCEHYYSLQISTVR